RRIPLTHFVFACGVFAISGFPPASGFFSKDEILASAFASHVPGHEILYGIGLLTAGITAFYMWRLYFLVFSGELRAPKEVVAPLPAPPPVIPPPLLVLAVLAVVGGLLGVPEIYGRWLGIEHSHSLANFLTPVWAPADPHEIERATEYMMTGAAVGIALL